MRELKEQVRREDAEKQAALQRRIDDSQSSQTPAPPQWQSALKKLLELSYSSSSQALEAIGVGQGEPREPTAVETEPARQ